MKKSPMRGLVTFRRLARGTDSVTPLTQSTQAAGDEVADEQMKPEAQDESMGWKGIIQARA